jgi:hypothetical protein
MPFNETHKIDVQPVRAAKCAAADLVSYTLAIKNVKMIIRVETARGNNGKIDAPHLIPIYVDLALLKNIDQLTVNFLQCRFQVNFAAELIMQRSNLV